MKYIKSINEYLVNHKLKYSNWLSKTIVNDIEKNGISTSHISYNSTGLSFYISSEHIDDLKKSINKTNNILKKWKDYTLDKDNIILIFKSTSFEQYNDISAKFTIYYKTLKIKRVKPSRYVYHQTKPEYLEDILKNGLLPKDSSNWINIDYTLEYPPAIFTTNVIFNKKDTSRLFHKNMEEFILLRIDTTKIPNKWYYDLNMMWDENIPTKYIMTFEPIPPKAIKLIQL